MINRSKHYHNVSNRVLALITLLTFFFSQIPLQVKSAAFSTGGNSAWAPNILWSTWGTPGNIANDPGTAGVLLQNGDRTSASMVIGGQTLYIVCSLSNVKGAIKSYTPGTNPGDGLDNLYHVGGPNSANTLVNGIINANPGEKVSFDITCSATLGGVPFDLPGFVFADSEQLTGKDNISIAGEGEWFITDRAVGGTCTGRAYQVWLNGNGTSVTLQAGATSLTACPSPSDPANFGPLGGGVLEFAPTAYVGTNRQVTANITLSPSKVDPATGNTGYASMAIGLLPYNIDTSDAAGYLPAANFFPFKLSDDTLYNGNNKNIMESTFIMSAPTLPVSDFLGTYVDADGWDVVPNVAADSDDLTGIMDDEDGIGVVQSFDLVFNGTDFVYRLPVTCNGSGYVNGWIDRNRNYSFDAGGTSITGPVQCVNGQAILDFAIPVDAAIVPGPTYIRLRYGYLMEYVLDPNGLQNFGEVEDHAFTMAPELSIDKTVTSTGPYDVTNNNVIRYQVVVQNVGNLGLTGVTVADPGLDNFTCSKTLPTPLYLDETITCTGTHTVTQADVDAGFYSNTATTDSQQTNPVSDTETVTFIQTPSMSLTKTETSVGPYDVKNNTLITYQITLTNTGNITLNNIVISETTGNLSNCSPLPSDPLPPGGIITCDASHTVVQDDIDRGVYINRVTGLSSRTTLIEASHTVTFLQNPDLRLDKVVYQRRRQCRWRGDGL